MEYTTVLIDLAQVRSKKVLQEVDTQYRQTIIQYAERGWKLLGIHNIRVPQKNGCIAAMQGNPYSYRCVDLMIFFRE